MSVVYLTDTKNQIMYPSPALIKFGRYGGWYRLPYLHRYGLHSPALPFYDPGSRYLHKGQKMRIWYGEDLYNFTEYDNHGHTCMDVYVSPNI